MISVHNPTVARDVCEDFAHLFRGTRLTFGKLCALCSFFLFGADSLCEGARILPLSPSVSTLAEAIKDFSAEAFMRRLRRTTRERLAGPLEEPGRFIFVVDDTAIPKAGKKNHAVGLWSTSNNICYHGQKLLVLALVDVKAMQAIPIGFRFCLKSDVPGYKSGHDLVVDLVDEALEAGFPRLPLVADSWFDAVDMITALKERQVPVFVEVKRNRKVRHCAARNVPGKTLKRYFREGRRESVTLTLAGRKRKTKFVNMKHAYLLKLNSPVRIAAVFNRHLGHDIYGFFLTTDMEATPTLIWTMSRARWAIECLFRDLKQSFALGRLPGRSRQDAEISVCLPFALIGHLRLQSYAAQESKREPRRETIGARVAQIRERCLDETIRALVSGRRKHLQERLQARRSPERIREKPVNTGATRMPLRERLVS